MPTLSDRQPTKVLDKGFVALEDSMGGDLSVVNSARVSYLQHKMAIEIEDEKLIGYLMKNRHGTPFEHNSFMFKVKAPIFVFREWHRHRIASINEWSARYSKLEPDFYIPAMDDVRERIGKPGHYKYVPIGFPEDRSFATQLENHCKMSFDRYEHSLEVGIAPELARCFLPVNIYSQMYWTVNARSLMNFLSLRAAETAQYEIRVYAEAMEDIFKQCMPITAAAFVENGRVAP